ncbi:MAG: fumarate hydratase C-terminal domain-containing protein [Actinobacteria bacterium]|nr:fumarate hydratase C-terminal domain-containing protein [Actinomycetota bacterium]
MAKKLNMPLSREKIERLKAGDFVLLSGTIIGARDAAHKRIISAIKNDEKLPFEPQGQIIFYVGPSPTPEGKPSGSIGPTTSARMDEMTEPLLARGLLATIGKGARSEKLKDLLKKYKAVYFIAPGGVAAYLAEKVKKINVAAYADLGPEAVFFIEVKELPLFVAYDINGGDIFKQRAII